VGGECSAERNNECFPAQPGAGVLEALTAMQPNVEPAAVTVLLKELQAGNSAAADRLIPIIFRELRNLADMYIRREKPGHTLQPTALVHEAYLRLVGAQAREWQNRAHFIGVAASVMRRLLIDHARKKRAEKPQSPAPNEWNAGLTVQEAELLTLNVALDRLEKSNARYARVVELRFFGGLTVDEAAEVMQVSSMTIKRDWTAARAWLKLQLQPTKRGSRGN
jgi:RNA polymerase sigma-70 factor (ECF subfamily)